MAIGAWGRIRKDYAEALKPSHNKQSTAIAQIAEQLENTLDCEHMQKCVDCEGDIRVLKESLMEIHQEEQSIDSELLTVQRENDRLKLYLASITRLLISKGVLSKEEIEKMVDIIDAEDGVMDGKARGEVL